ncbi:Alpha/Beta hydrolase protein [Syncephalis pseudoplumigaleata]|uniref:Alpha/Beta hydrolase protein n=1 Tax=Syncephalis pseudoplumigaleata TaxID=1712513 RepID=A0A4V1J242_9FUNG|nr:Alpha/Beta hydrolase protein [Syncephalis pseudoplumigaleata]|eukprot:RKP27249.1 Alpha/Beta hydrolase protein [Syncephalis pseudoplumigaleata]
MIAKTSPVRLVAAAEPCLQLAYRRYQLRPQHGRPAVRCNMLVAHATGLCKEVYAPLLDRIGTADGEAITLDMRNHGDSMLANRPAFDSGKATTVAMEDYSKDIGACMEALAMDSRRVPIIGIGHSAGATGILLVEAARPGTFSAIVAIDPVLSVVDLHDASQPAAARYMNDVSERLAAMVRRRRDRWPDRAAAHAYLNGRGIYANWSKDAFDAFISVLTATLR